MTTHQSKTHKSNSSSSHSNNSASSSSSNSTQATSPSTGGTEYFANCTELRKKYPHGVPSTHPAYSSRMDRDHDNFACEKN
ncbi:excalibur calcium-binding domain-containing protein [Bacillus amyloliquefaciens]|uniref:excalibur calcium-binding domain-containing protein n=1 Tax=Bacillus amyloliquefaciens TaxID=1390 RepID=UPI00384BF559